MKYIYSIVLVLITFSLYSQKEYSLVKSEGIIPDEIIKMNKSIYHLSKDTVKGNRSEVNDKNEFLLKSNYQLGNLLKSGKILFGDRFTKYVTKVGDNLLKDYPELQKNIKFYVVKSAEVNAYSTQQGYLFVNLGLLAQVENEAQLAFVLAHELIHYTEKHNIESFLKGKELERGVGQYRKLTNNEQKGYFLKYSKENEMEADRKGFEDFYLKAGYDVNEALSVFDVLLYSYLPVDEIEFDTTFFNDEYFKISRDYLLKEQNEITAVEDYDDSEHYHPNIKKRRERFIDYIADNEVEEGKKYLFSKVKFKEIQNDARYELSNLHTINTYYCAAIYNSYILLQKNKDDIFLKRNIAYALYAMSKYKTHKSIRDILPRTKKIEGQSQQLYSIFNKINEDELNILALKYNWNLYNKTSDPQFKRQYKDLLKDLTYENNLYYNSFEKVIKDTADKFIELTKAEYNNLSKYDKIRYDKKKKSIDKVGTEGIAVSLIDILSSSKEFSKEFSELSKKAKEEKENDENNDNKEPKKRRIKTIDDSINKILVSNPFFMKYDDNGKRKHIESEEREFEYIEMLRQIAKRAKVEIDVLDIYTITNADVDKFNQIALINSWVKEFSNHQDYKTLWELYSSQDIFLKEVLNAYDKQHFSISGTLTKDSGPKIIIQYFYLIDSENGNVVLSNYSELPSKDYNAPIKSFLYDSFFNLKSQY